MRLLHRSSHNAQYAQYAHFDWQTWDNNETGNLSKQIVKTCGKSYETKETDECKSRRNYSTVKFHCTGGRPNQTLYEFKLTIG